MKIKRLTLIFLLLFTAWLQLQAETLDQKKLIGKWQYSAPTAPLNYSSGQINFTQAGDSLKGELVIGEQKMDFSSITIREDVISFTVNLDSNPVTVKFKLVNQKLEGKADTPDGPVEVTASRK